MFQSGGKSDRQTQWPSGNGGFPKSAGSDGIPRQRAETDVPANLLVCGMIMRCNINGFCVLAAASSVWLHARRGAEALRASRRRGRLSLVARWRHKVLPAHRRGERGATTWAFSSNFCTEVHGCGMQWPCGRLRNAGAVKRRLTTPRWATDGVARAHQHLILRVMGATAAPATLAVWRGTPRYS